MASANTYFGIGSIVWIDSGEHKNWPARICLCNSKKPQKWKDQFWVVLYGKRKGTWVPKNSVKVYESGGNLAPSYPIDSKWIQAVKEADMELRGISVGVPSRSSATAASCTEDRNNFNDRKIVKRSKVVYCCGVPRSKSVTVKAQGRKISNPFIFLPKLPDTVFSANEIFPIEHKSCCISSRTAIPNEIIDKEDIEDSNCFKCIMNTIDQTQFKIGIFDTGNDIAKPMAHRLVLHNDLYIVEQDSEVEHWHEIENKGAKCLKTMQFFLTISDLILCCTQSLDAVKNVLLTRDEVFPYIRKDKAYVFFTPMTHETCLDIAEIIHKGEGRFLDAVLLTRSLNADMPFENKSVLLVSGDRDVYDKFEMQFKDISHHVKFLGEAGNATFVNTIVSLTIGSLVGCFRDASELAEKCGLLPNDDCYEDFLNMVSVTTGHSELLTHRDITKALPASVQRFMRDGLGLAATYRVDTPVVNAAFHKIQSLASEE